MVLLERILPDYQFHELHAVEVNAPAAEVFAVLGAIAPGELPIFPILMAVRSLPAWAAGRRPAFGRGEAQRVFKRVEHEFSAQETPSMPADDHASERIDNQRGRSRS
jgi:hypothetical protein